MKHRLSRQAQAVLLGGSIVIFLLLSSGAELALRSQGHFAGMVLPVPAVNHFKLDKPFAVSTEYVTDSLGIMRMGTSDTLDRRVVELAHEYTYWYSRWKHHPKAGFFEQNTHQLAEFGNRIRQLVNYFQQYHDWKDYNPIERIVTDKLLNQDSLHPFPEFQTQLLAGWKLDAQTREQQHQWLAQLEAEATRLRPQLARLPGLPLPQTQLLPYIPEGFRSIPFDTSAGAAYPSVMFLGDSFTFGHSAEPISSCFADLTALRGFRVYNTGISSTDPAQYARIAEVYAPRLRPDHVVLMFYMGNDLMLYPRTAEPNKAPYYSTSVGLLNGCPMGEYLPDAGAAYRFLLATHFIPDQATNRFNRWCAKTVLTTRLWMVLARWGWVKRYGEEFQAYYERNLPRHRFEDQHYAEAYVLQAKAAAEAAGATFDCVIIPQRGQYDRETVLKRLHFQQVKPVWFDGFDDRHYVSGNDDHFNNAGHARMAEHIAHLLAARRQKH